MTRKFDDEVGARTIDANQIPQAKTYPNVESTTNKREERNKYIEFHEISNTSGDALLEFTAPDKGKIVAVTLVNGSVACDGSNGLELEFLNKTAADAQVAYVGFGSGTEAAKATDKDSAVAAYETSAVKVTDTSTINKDDVILCTVDRDGTTVVGIIIVEYQVSAEGRTA